MTREYLRFTGELPFRVGTSIPEKDPLGEVDRRFREILGEVAKEPAVAILVVEVMPDDVHLFVNAPPDRSPSDIIARIKGRTSKGRFSKTFGLGRSLRGCGRGWTPQMIREAQRL